MPAVSGIALSPGHQTDTIRDSHCPKADRTGWEGEGSRWLERGGGAVPASAEPAEDPAKCFDYQLSGTRLESLMLTLET